ncbi:MAG: ABC transporter permease [Clostridiales bacterium]|nr:ABC transporter permease [Clostridiales bacterium]
MQWIKKHLATLSRLSILLVMFLLLVIVSPSFGTMTNILNVLRVSSLTLMVATGIALCMLVGGIDLSVGATIALTSILFGSRFQLGHGIGDMVFGIAGILVVSALIGACNGFCVAWLRIPPFLATYGIQQIARGLAYVLTNGLVYSNFTSTFQFIGGGRILGIHTPIIFAALLLLIVGLMLNKTTLGRRIYAVGSNREAARYSGINVNATLMMAYILSGIIAGFAGIVYTSRLNCAEPTIGSEFAQEAIAAAAIGGISFKGGHGNVFGVVVGALILTLITNGMTLLSIDSNWQVGATGVIIILAVLIDRNTAKKKH